MYEDKVQDVEIREAAGFILVLSEEHPKGKLLQNYSGQDLRNLLVRMYNKGFDAAAPAIMTAIQGAVRSG
jgi:hypothetical protein